MKARYSICTVLVVLVLALTACIPTGEKAATQDEEIATSVAATVAAAETQKSLNTVVAELTRIAQFTATPVPPTETPLPTFTNTVTLTPTATFTNTPVPTATPVPPTATATTPPLPCDKIEFVSDVTVPDGTTFLPNKSFTKTWRLKNGGSCTWSTSYSLVFIGGNSFGATTISNLATNVNPGEMIDISIPMVAPSTAGSYTGYWQMRNASGGLFGWGTNSSSAFWVTIQVVITTATINPDNPLNFAVNFCSAQWSSSKGNLPCPGSGTDFTNGSVVYSTSPILEGGYQEDEPSIIVIPSDGSGGMITGKYPAIAIKTGDRFVAMVGCVDKRPKCDVMFQVNYSADGGAITNLGSWTETFDGSYTHINENLDFLAGKSVVFYLVVQNNGSSLDDRVFWTDPAISRK
ncbi:MAG: NBR1-Ig-like domain-containing protein [Anaerolineaceae bacterium]